MIILEKKKIYKINKNSIIMNLGNVYLTTLIPEFPRIYNYNNNVFKNYLDVIYNESTGVVIVPVNTTGRVKGATGEFVNLVVDNLTVRSQYTNLYENSTTADFDYYSTYIAIDASYRDASTTAGEDANFKYIDAVAPYYKLNNSNTDGYAFKTNTASQIVELLFDISTGDAFLIKLNDSSTLSITAAAAASAFVQLICVGLPGVSSSDNIWVIKQYGGNGAYTII